MKKAEQTQTTLFDLAEEHRWTLEEQAGLFDITISSLHKWTAEGYPTQGTLKDMIRWVRANRPLLNDTTLSEARKEKVQVETELRRLELLIRRGELILKSQVSALFVERVMIVRSGLLNFHRVIESKMMGRDLSELGAIVKVEAHGLLDRYSRRTGILQLKVEKNEK